MARDAGDGPDCTVLESATFLLWKMRVVPQQVENALAVQVENSPYSV